MLQSGVAKRSSPQLQVDSSASCADAEVSRRRRAGSMCSCRRRGGPTCQSGGVVLDAATGGEIKVMSYNLFGWNAFNVHRARSVNVLGKIRAWSPTILGAQEVEMGGGQRYDEVKE